MSTANQPVDRAVAARGDGSARGSSLVRIAVSLLGVAVGAQALIAASGSGLSPVVRPAQGLVESVVNAPVVPDGVVTARAADFVITLDSDLDPRVPGRSLLAGRSIRVILPDAFERDPAIPFATLFSIPDCMPLNVRCNTAFLLQGWPQHPVGFPPANMPSLWTVDFDEATNSVVLTALQDLRADPPNEPGIKQVHLVLAGFANPRPGRYVVRVISETGPNGETESGWAPLLIRPRVRPTLALTSALNPGAPNTIYQTAAVNAATPFPYDLLLWDRTGAPLTDVTVEQTSRELALLLQNRRPVGYISIDAPDRARGQYLTSETPSFSAISPVVGVPTARVSVFFTTGDTPGAYVLRFALFGGNSVETFVNVE